MLRGKDIRLLVKSDCLDWKSRKGFPLLRQNLGLERKYTLTLANKTGGMAPSRTEWKYGDAETEITLYKAMSKKSLSQNKKELDYIKSQ